QETTVRHGHGFPAVPQRAVDVRGTLVGIADNAPRQSRGRRSAARGTCGTGRRPSRQVTTAPRLASSATTVSQRRGSEASASTIGRAGAGAAGGTVGAARL